MTGQIWIVWYCLLKSDMIVQVLVEGLGVDADEINASSLMVVWGLRGATY